MIDVHGFGGMFRDFPTLGECQAACEKDNTCVAIDWEPSNAGKSCWFLTSTATGRTLHLGVIIHYQLDRACLSQCHFYWARFAFTLHRVPSLDDIVSISPSSSNDLGWRWKWIATGSLASPYLFYYLVFKWWPMLQLSLSHLNIFAAIAYRGHG